MARVRRARRGACSWRECGCALGAPGANGPTAGRHELTGEHWISQSSLAHRSWEYDALRSVPMKPTWREPPRGGKRNPNQRLHDERLALLREISRWPGRWALFASLGRPGAATDLATRVRANKFLAGFDATTYDTDVYVRFVGDTPLGPHSRASPAVVWKDPPDDGRVGQNENMEVRDRRVALLREIASRPGQWALFATMGTPASARNVA